MAQLSEAQVEIIQGRIIKNGVANTGLQNDLLDHFCCYIEAELEQNDDFENAYNKAFLAITPHGMHEIEEELFFLLTFKKQTNMRRIIYGFGFMAAFLISMSLLFRAMHWPGVPFLHISGFAMLIIASSALFINALKHFGNHTMSYNIRVTAGFIAAFFTSTGSIFKMLQYPTANMQIALGMVVLNFVFMPMFFMHLYKESLNKQPK